jgi:SAM-dependent methyltransferase
MNPQEYDRMRQLEDWYWWFVARREAALRFTGDYRPSSLPLRILDAGCGTGALLDRLQSWPGVELYGLDYSGQALAYTRQRGHHHLIQGDLTRLPFPDGTFDVVTALDVVEHIREDEGALREVNRILRPGGVLLVSVPAYRFLWGPHDTALQHFRRYTRREMATLMRRAGFRVSKLTYLLALLFPAFVAQRLLARLHPAPDHPKAQLVRVNQLVNRFLIRLQALELAIARHLSLPFGATVFCVAQKPGSGVQAFGRSGVQVIGPHKPEPSSASPQGARSERLNA